MKLLKIKIKGLDLFKDELTIDFFAQQRVGPDKNEMLTKVFSNIYINNVISFVGINASGKTSVLKVISFIIKMLNNEPINTINSNDILDGADEIVIESYFYSEENNLNKLRTVIEKGSDIKNGESKYKIKEEALWKKEINKIKTKKSIFDFKQSDLVQIRDKNEEFLMEDVSIIIALNKKSNSSFYMKDMIKWTNTNRLHLIGQFPSELITFLDPSIEYLFCNKKDKDIEIRLKFFDKEEILLVNTLELNNYLSSGTIKGINVFLNAMLVFDNGGYLIVDELENHFNREIVATLIRFFMNREVNSNGATMIFSTHYSELLDEFDRNDNIYIVRNRQGIHAENLSKILNRNDIKKSEVYQSGYLQGTVPAYKAYLALRKAIISSRIKEV